MRTEEELMHQYAGHIRPYVAPVRTLDFPTGRSRLKWRTGDESLPLSEDSRGSREREKVDDQSAKSRGARHHGRDSPGLAEAVGCLRPTLGRRRAALPIRPGDEDRSALREPTLGEGRAGPSAGVGEAPRGQALEQGRRGSSGGLGAHYAAPTSWLIP